MRETTTALIEHYADALVASRERAAATGALVVHAYDQAEVLAGQGTVARELEEQAPGLDTALVAVGGGGLVGGTADSLARSAVVTEEGVMDSGATLRDRLGMATGAEPRPDLVGLADPQPGGGDLGRFVVGQLDPAGELAGN